MPNTWKQALDNFGNCLFIRADILFTETTEIERAQTMPIFMEAKKILQGSCKDFETFKRIGPFVVSFVDDNRKICIQVEFATLLGNLAISTRF